ncbi:type II secretion system F family protein [Streptomyces sp. RB6PN25]|uniref:Type II secretion system F family protein n=1 Tax=Streptomyces humicola TaxID=2953240 RepID=A0ABT1Q386_9ACTN|nr:type II secretion system F family protein [Streptomyces humicola]MCQ4084393.1 type II secretion system F family protein [Streptomyces humicola]
MIGIVLGALFGAGVLAAVLGLRPPRPSLATTLAALQRPSPRHTASPTDGLEQQSAGGWAARWGRVGVPLLRAAGLPTAALRADLELVGMSVERYLAEKAAATAVGLIAPPVVIALVGAVLHAGVGWWLPVWSALFSAVVMFRAPDLGVRSQAAARRSELRHALAVFLDLVVIALAGGAGVQQALTDAAGAGHGWAAARIRRAVATASLARTGVWDELAALGQATGVSEFSELAATVGLAGAEGAKVRQSLATKAAAMRARRLAEADGAAQAATERMSLPVVLMFAAFLVFIGYPAMMRVLVST